MTAREKRLRRRIDKLTAERDNARRLYADRLRRLDYWRCRARDLKRSRDMWRHRAVNR